MLNLLFFIHSAVEKCFGTTITTMLIHVHFILSQLSYLDAGIGLKLRNGTVRDTKIPDEILKSSKN